MWRYLIAISIYDIGMLMILIDSTLAMIIMFTLTSMFILLYILFVLVLIHLLVYYLDHLGECYPCYISISIIIFLA